jgi:aminoglycoside phosphotransferase (APT) family kinase protein
VLKAVGGKTHLPVVAWRQAFLDHLRHQGLQWVPRPCTGPGPVSAGTSQPQAFPMFTSDTQGTCWQCLSWVPGVPLPAANTSQIGEAVTALAEVHRFGRSFSQRFPVPWDSGWSMRQRQLLSIATQGWPSAASNGLPTDHSFAPLRRWCHEAACVFQSHGGSLIVGCLLSQQLAVQQTQPVMRDIWWGHVMFQSYTGTQASFAGMIDWDAAAIDTPITDLSRLLGSWHLVSGDPEACLVDQWPEALSAYESITALSEESRATLQLYHDTAVVCGLARWYEWVLQENRVFPDMSAVHSRIKDLQRALPAALLRLKALCGGRSSA